MWPEWLVDRFPLIRDFRRSRRSYRHQFGRNPSFFFPASFNEKLQRYKLTFRDKRLPVFADKVLVKEFVAERLGSDWIVPTLWHGARLPDINQRAWPVPFVIKANHGSVMNMFVRSTPNWPAIERCCQEWLSSTYDAGGEWHYRLIKRQLLVEPFVGAGGALPVDFKLYTFGGKVKLVELHTGRENNHKSAMFDVEWNRLSFNIEDPLEDRPIGAPKSFELMIGAAERLAVGLPFVRVDFYEIDEKPKFSEMTFFPGAGTNRFHPPEYDLIVGKLWT